MFKKKMNLKCQQSLSGAERKKLLKTIKESFPNASDQHIQTLFPPKVEIIVSKYLNRAIAYSLKGGFPMFFEVDGRGTQILPTVFALWEAPELLPAFVLKGAEVSRSVIGGEDLMFSDISMPSKGLTSYLAGEIWAVKVPGNRAPIAVGITTRSSFEAIKVGSQGNVLNICHSYRDSLWRSVEGCHVPNAGFLEDVVLEDPALISSCEDSEQFECNVPICHENDMHNKEFQEAIAATVGHLNSDPALTMLNDFRSDPDEDLITSMVDLKVMENVSSGQHNAKDQKSLMDIDMLLDRCLLQALHATVSKKDLPMRASTLWSNHVLRCRPPGIVLDIKKSSYKKLSKWLQLKSSTGLISVKEDKYKKEAMLCAINYNHPDYTSSKLEDWQSDKNEQDNAISAGSPHKIKEVAEMYKPSDSVKHIFASVGADTKKIFSISEVIDILFSYIDKENLVKSTDDSIVVLDAPLSEALFVGIDKQVIIGPYEFDKYEWMTSSSDSEVSDSENLVQPADVSIVVRDAPLSDALFKGVNEQGSICPYEIDKNDLVVTFINRMQAYHLVKRGSESVLRKGALKMIKIMTGRRHGNKKVTQISGLESYLIDSETLALELKKKFSCITSVAGLPGKKVRAVVIQGGGVDHFMRYLVEHYGVPKTNIQVVKRANNRV